MKTRATAARAIERREYIVAYGIVVGANVEYLGPLKAPKRVPAVVEAVTPTSMVRIRILGRNPRSQIVSPFAVRPKDFYLRVLGLNEHGLMKHARLRVERLIDKFDRMLPVMKENAPELARAFVRTRDALARTRDQLRKTR